jgi:hypothetical protein
MEQWIGIMPTPYKQIGMGVGEDRQFEPTTNVTEEPDFLADQIAKENLCGR